MIEQRPVNPVQGQGTIAIRGLVLDAEDVLYDATVWKRWFLQLLTRIGLHTSYRAFYRLWECEYMPDVNRRRCGFWDAMRSYLLSSGLSPGQIEEVFAASAGRFRQWQQPAVPFPGVVSTLNRLAEQGMSLGVVANTLWSADRLSENLRRLGIHAPLQCVVSSYDAAEAMPAAGPYRCALQRLGLDARQVAFVGHDEPGLAGARAIGMPTIAFNYQPSTRADIYLQRFDQLPQAVRWKAPQLLAS